MKKIVHSIIAAFWCSFSCSIYSMYPVHDQVLQTTMVGQFAKDIAELKSITKSLGSGGQISKDITQTLKNDLDNQLSNVKDTLDKDITDVNDELKTQIHDDITKLDLNPISVDLTSVLNDLAEMLQNGTQYAYKLAVENKSTLFAGYKMPDGKTYSDQYRDIADNLQNLLNNVLATMNSSASENKKDDILKMQEKIADPKSQVMIAQAGAQIAAKGVTQLQLLNQTMIAQTNAQTAYYAAQTQKESSAKAEIDSIINSGEANDSKNLWDNPLNLPWK